ncbi:MAG: acyltransferase [Bacteroidetes bacterium]|nr:acyltransferase [Bacteroidota bacterium]
MSPIFFISGFLAPSSQKNKNSWGFIKSKFRRLIIPWIIAVLTLIPLYKVIFLYSRNLPQEAWTTYFHWNSLWSQNWLWFLPVIFLFDLLYLFISKLDIKMPNLTLKGAIWVTFLVSYAFGFCMDCFNLHDWTKTILVDFQNEKLLIYLMVFLLGVVCFKLKVFESDWKNKKLDITLHCTSWIPLNIYIYFVIYNLIKPDDPLISEVVDTLLVRLNYMLSLAYLLYILIISFKNYLNKQTKISKALNANSYSVYIIHVIVMGALALPMLYSAIPSLLRFLILAVGTWVVSNLIVSVYRRVINNYGDSILIYNLRVPGYN